VRDGTVTCRSETNITFLENWHACRFLATVCVLNVHSHVGVLSSSKGKPVARRGRKASGL